MTLPPHALASLAFRRWCFSFSDAVFRSDGKRSALLRVLSDIPPILL